MKVSKDIWCLVFCCCCLVSDWLIISSFLLMRELVEEENDFRLKLRLTQIRTCIFFHFWGGKHKIIACLCNTPAREIVSSNHRRTIYNQNYHHFIFLVRMVSNHHPPCYDNILGRTGYESPIMSRKKKKKKNRIRISCLTKQSTNTNKPAVAPSSSAGLISFPISQNICTQEQAGPTERASQLNGLVPLPIISRKFFTNKPFYISETTTSSSETLQFGVEKEIPLPSVKQNFFWADYEPFLAHMSSNFNFSFQVFRLLSSFSFVSSTMCYLSTINYEPLLQKVPIKICIKFNFFIVSKDKLEKKKTWVSMGNDTNIKFHYGITSFKVLQTQMDASCKMGTSKFLKKDRYLPTDSNNFYVGLFLKASSLWGLNCSTMLNQPPLHGLDSAQKRFGGTFFHLGKMSSPPGKTKAIMIRMMIKRIHSYQSLSQASLPQQTISGINQCYEDCGLVAPEILKGPDIQKLNQELLFNHKDILVQITNPNTCLLPKNKFNSSDSIKCCLPEIARGVTALLQILLPDLDSLPGI
ncbi:hypothetical protein VP01_185g2 [Puccinia sorghi]|uniref:Uncharacterized protein n=1 Tax=Puccinia sorghi TaxID=27349 RepID=A0A0L6VFB2_9BASI|nr:hypothetical protein VP01_185g2 [Puccinia sorghi]